MIPLIGFLMVLMGMLEVMRPGILSPFWAGNLIKFAIPLAMLAAAQVLTMLTGGIDLSVGIVATRRLRHGDADAADRPRPGDGGGDGLSARWSGLSTASAPVSRGCIR